MPLFLKQQTDTYTLAVWQMEETFDELCRLLPRTDLQNEALQRFLAPTRRTEWMAIRVLLYHLLGEYHEIAYHPSGKPYLKEGLRHIGISHTKGYVALILGTRPVGIDIEQYSERVQRIVHKFMRTDEVAHPYDGSTTWGLLLHWSAKEVMFKCMDASEVDFREHLQVFPFTPQAQGGVFQAREYKTPQQQTFNIQYLLHPDFVLTICEA